MKVLQEITKWDIPTPNHTYFSDDSKSKIYGYIRVGTNDVFTFKKPIRIDVRGRKFLEVPNSWGFTVEDKPEGKTWEVKGSKGDVYTVAEVNGNRTCTCSGFKFRGKCKHVDLVK
jgi:hypothetical protein